MSNENPFSLVESRALEGERGQPIGACQPFYTPHSLFFLIFPFFLFSSFFFFLCVYLFAMVLLEIAITVFVIVIPPPVCTVRFLYIVSAMTGFYYFSL